MDNNINVREVLSITTDTGEFYYYVICRFAAGLRDYIALTSQFGNDDSIQLFRCSAIGSSMQVSNIESGMELDDVKSEFNKMLMNERNKFLSNDNIDTVITITLDDGTKCICNIVCIFDFEGNEYIAVMPIDRPNDSQIGIGLYEYSAINDDKGEVGISLSPIPVYLFPRIRDYFMELSNNEVNP